MPYCIKLAAEKGKDGDRRQQKKRRRGAHLSPFFHIGGKGKEEQRDKVEPRKGRTVLLEMMKKRGEGKRMSVQKRKGGGDQ